MVLRTKKGYASYTTLDCWTFSWTIFWLSKYKCSILFYLYGHNASLVFLSLLAIMSHLIVTQMLNWNMLSYIENLANYILGGWCFLNTYTCTLQKILKKQISHFNSSYMHAWNLRLSFKYLCVIILFFIFYYILKTLKLCDKNSMK